MDMMQSNGHSDESRDVMMMFGGVALMLMGAGMVLTSPTVRRYLGGFNLSGLLQSAGPDFERYMKLRSM